mmetsp:Transcript_6474/g.14993  ORF Transcript_6474/g.14993 Transcript_6474/m.14993 type:complete len:430 (+) Transcript_6474:1862-3151(+)
MQALPPKLAANLLDYGRHLEKEAARSISCKQRGTDDSRLNFYLTWFAAHGGVGDPRMPHAPLQARNFVLACYTVALVRGETLKGIFIKKATIQGYIRQVEKMMTGFCHELERRLPNPLNARINYVAMILKAVEKYEGMTERKEMIYDEMFLDMIDRFADAPPDSAEAAILDWLLLGRYTGPRAVEWCQTTLTEYLRIDHPYWRGPDSYAFIAADFVFLDRHKRPIRDLAGATIDDVHYVQIRWRKQKNNDNGQIIPYVRDEANLRFCPVYAALRIRQRALRLNVADDHPIGAFAPHTRRAVARLPQGRRYLFITKKMVEQMIQDSAVRTFRLDATDRQRWSAHSPRITACNLLHRQGLPDSYIKLRLRWRSLAFQDYLRNTFYSATRHTTALHITEENLPRLSDPATGDEIPHTRPQEEIVQLLACPSP